MPRISTFAVVLFRFFFLLWEARHKMTVAVLNCLQIFTCVRRGAVLVRGHLLPKLEQCTTFAVNYSGPKPCFMSLRRD